MILLRAINLDEFREFLVLNNVGIENLNMKQDFLFNVYKNTIWVDNEVGLKRYNIYRIADSDRSVYSGIVLGLKIGFFNKDFQENPNDIGKYYCINPGVKDVKIAYIPKK
ncbi:hypothetical protein J4214_04940 [Candidatus Woesearchaeota archaeon]|nr:hypothetical protein [Candidatus Woesearchaeota archaeon]